jgi:hypothetical protein
MTLKWDMWKGMVRSLASLDQRLQPFKEYYLGLSEENRAGFRKWVLQISQPFPNDLEGLCQMMSDIGCTGDTMVGASISVDFLTEGQSAKSAKVEPQFLRQAIEAWDQGNDFVPPIGWDM